MKETLKTMKDMLIGQTQAQISNLQCADYEELGAAIDMIKDLEEALYYCVIVEAMEKSDEEKRMSNTYYYTERYIPAHDDYYYRDMDKDSYGKMYYSSDMSGNQSSDSSSSGRDMREGRSPVSRRNYMESKATHQDKSKQLKELESYMQELTADITEMITGASPEEKQLLQKKLSTLSTKIEQMN